MSNQGSLQTQNLKVVRAVFYAGVYSAQGGVKQCVTPKQLVIKTKP